jgi:hypothetical protein
LLLFDLLIYDLTYCIVLGLWMVGLVAALFGLLWLRRKHRGKRGKVAAIHAGLSLWMVLAFATAAEAAFALFVDRSDTFDVTNISKRWFRRHLDAQRREPLGNRDSEPFTKFVIGGKQRIAFVGDSFTAGHGVNNMADRFSDRIRAKLEAAKPGRFVVANLAEPGWETSQIEAFVHKLLIDGNDMKYVVYVYCMNDIEGFPMLSPSGELDWNTPIKKSLGQIYTDAPGFFLWRDTYLYNWLYYRFLQARNPDSRSYFDALAECYQTTQWDLLSKKITQLRNDCREKNVELRIALFPFLHQLGPDNPLLDAHAKLAAFCKEQGIRVLDLEPTFREHASENLTVNAFDAHPNERAHAIAADAMERALLEDLIQ